MKDDWSLKDKKKRYNPEINFYYEWDIETLRQKLILKYKKGELNEETINELFGM